MTMKRNEKAGHAEMLETVSSFTGLVLAQFASPTEIAKRGGRKQMKVAEYKASRMGRGTREAGVAREIKNSESRYRWMTRVS